ncbi:MAG: hypothetical protein QE488_08480 [Acidovorax sp.]|nr:hypothetical protein [Acidovorax sp.]
MTQSCEDLLLSCTSLLSAAPEIFESEAAMRIMPYPNVRNVALNARSSREFR